MRFFYAIIKTAEARFSRLMTESTQNGVEPRCGMTERGRLSRWTMEDCTSGRENDGVYIHQKEHQEIQSSAG